MSVPRSVVAKRAVGRAESMTYDRDGQPTFWDGWRQKCGELRICWDFQVPGLDRARRLERDADRADHVDARGLAAPPARVTRGPRRKSARRREKMGVRISREPLATSLAPPGCQAPAQTPAQTTASESLCRSRVPGSRFPGSWFMVHGSHLRTKNQGTLNP